MKGGASELLIALSAGGSNDELAAQGLGIEHVNELMIRMAMRLLREGHRMAFGGTLGVSSQALTEFLIHAAESWLNEESPNHSEVTRSESWPLMNWSAWPFHTFISDEQRAALVGICHFVNVDPSGVRKASLDAAVQDWEKNPRARLYAADALSAMREQATRETDLRIVWGGKIAGAKGWMPGILEEVAFSLLHGKPVLVLGGFGGCARLLADFLAEEDARWPVRLSLAACADPERDKLCTESKRKALDKQFKQAKKLLLDFRSKLYSSDTVNGLDAGLMRSALAEENARRAIHLAANAANEVARNP